MQGMKKRIASVVLAGSMMGVTALGAGAAPGGAKSVANQFAAALAAVQVGGVQVEVVELNNSLNNLTALNNVLNNSPILSNNDIIDDITITDVNVLSIEDSAVLNNFLNNANIAITDVVGVAVLSGGDLIIFTR